jgi:DNA-binding IclR family transcriptional regulator
VRLRVLQVVIESPGCCVTDIQHACRLPQSSTSHHLRQLQARGLLTARTSSRRVIYLPQTDPAVGHAKHIFAAAQAAQQRGETPAATSRLLKAFTQSRRITIVRALHLAAAMPDDLVRRCGISLPAVYRHLDNLTERAVVREKPKGVFRLNPDMPHLAQDLVHVACAEQGPPA